MSPMLAEVVWEALISEALSALVWALAVKGDSDPVWKREAVQSPQLEFTPRRPLPEPTP